MTVVLEHICTCGHTERDHDAYEPPYSCAHGMTVENPDSDCDCMDYDEAVALVSKHTLAELRAAREVIKEADSMRSWLPLGLVEALDAYYQTMGGGR